MRAYIIRRLLLVIPTVFIVSLIVFFLVKILPGDIIDAIQLQSYDTELDRAALEKELGLDAPVMVLYGRWLGVISDKDANFSGVFQGNLGYSWMKNMSVAELLAEKWPVTLELGIMALILSQLIALPIGIYSALRQDTWGDYVGRSFAILCISIPGFWLATLVIVMPAIWWGYMPPIMLIKFTDDVAGNLRMFIFPALILGMALSGITMRMTRTMMLEVLRQDYIRTAWAKGLGERLVILRHALKNALIPVVTILGLQAPVLVGGVVVIEQIFCLPGIGRLLVEAVSFRDYPLVTGIMLFFGAGMVLINLAVDIVYAYLDPRIKYK